MAALREAVIDSIRELSIQKLPTLEVTRVTIMCWCSTDNNIKIYFVEDTCVGQRMCRWTRKGRLVAQLERSKQALQQTLIQATWTTELSSSNQACGYKMSSYTNSCQYPVNRWNTLSTATNMLLNVVNFCQQLSPIYAVNFYHMIIS